MKNKSHFIKTWEASGNGVFEPDMIIAKAYKKVLASYKPKNFIYYQNNKNKLGEAYDAREELEKFDKSGYIDFQKKAYLKVFFKGALNAINNNKKVVEAIRKKDFNKISKSELFILLKLCLDSIENNFSYFFACQPQRFTLLEQLTKDKLLKLVPKEQLDEVFISLSSSTKDTPIIEEKLDWFKSLLIIKTKKLSLRDKEFNKIISKHHKKYAILGASDGKNQWPVSHFIKAAIKNKYSIAQIRTQIVNINNRKIKLKKQQQYFIKKYKVSHEIISLCSLFGEVGYYRLLMRINGWMPLYEEMKKVINIVAKTYNYDTELIRFCTIDEVMSIIKGKHITKNLLLERKKAFLIIYKYPQVKILAGQKANKKFKEIVTEENFKKLREITGTVAMKGKIVGRVLLFQWGDDIYEKLKKIKNIKDVILVTGQTRPQLSPLIAKCSAIVTDEGGIMSHSAIISRELGIPCIVGTMIGTRVFRDGDIVEVDANLGTVKIVKRKMI